MEVRRGAPLRQCSRAEKRLWSSVLFDIVKFGSTPGACCMALAEGALAYLAKIVGRSFRCRTAVFRGFTAAASLKGQDPITEETVATEADCDQIASMRPRR